MRRDLKTELIGLGVGLGGILLFWVIVEQVDRFQEQEELTAFDVVVADWVRGHVSGVWLEAGILLAQVGSVVVVLPLVLGAAVYSWSRGRRLEAASVALGALLLQLLVVILKAFFDRARPDVGLVVESGLSFPSGHSAFGAYLAVVMIWFTLRHVRRRSWALWFVAFAAVWALLQAVGRVLIGVHFVSDVLAGLGLGFAVGGLGLAAVPFAQRVTRWVREEAPWVDPK